MEMFLGGWALMVGVGMLPGTLPAARLVAMTRGALGGAAFLLYAAAAASTAPAPSHRTAGASGESARKPTAPRPIQTAA